MWWSRLVITAFFHVCFNTYILAQGDENFPPPSEPIIIKAERASGNIKIDGILNESDWSKAKPITDFFRMEPRQGGNILYETEVRILFDEKNLYVGAFCADSLGKKGVRVQDLRRDFNYRENDSFLVQLDPQNLKQYGVSFQTTPYGNQGDLQAFNDSNRDSNWNALWQVRTQRTPDGYFIEYAIPFKSLRYQRPEEGEDPTWGITIARLARRDFEQTVFPAIPQSFSPFRMTYSAQLEGLELPEPSANIRVEPYVLYQSDQVQSADQNFTDDGVKLGGDIKWAINPRSVLDLTFNTDFAQADVDRAVNNLERFNIFFPERRQFFLENSGIWAGAGNTDIVPFFSRTIGLQGAFNAAPARINAGTRFTDRNENRAIAALLINQAETENSQGANFFVGRYLQNYGNENNVGVMLTHRMDMSSNELGENTKNNTTVTVDGFIRPTDEWTVSYMVSGSRDNSTDTLGLAGRIFAGNSTNKYYLGWLSSFVSEQYNPDMGFVRQKNVIWHNPGGYYIWRPKNIPWIRRFDPGAFFNYYQDFKDPRKFQQASIYLFPIYLFFTDGSFFQYAIFPTWQNINFDFAPLGIRIEQGRYYYTRQQVNFNTDQSARFSVSGNVNWGDFYNGSRTTISGGLRFAPSPKASISIDHEYNNIKSLGEEEEDLKTYLTTAGARFALNPRLQISAFYQFNSFDQQGRWNIRGSWEYRPLSFVYLVFNDTRIENLDDPFREQQIIGKITFLKQF
ncbi:DUF5916 domain-containing protein [Algoriphagus sediminis]|uniref:DUF5916 domain-containing protein n=1 Tax=Algoriphagus sediminis TaxID=3057113 RepID=A0ABT7YD40_9BACT|nr:DUF5916 domain-containing protein [Algoriphagus sediminis]MDN3204440.1 DUF5916 domain-containing protein [Algoriphagus sediminis]